MHYYENSPITAGAIDYYANRLYNDYFTVSLLFMTEAE